MDRRDLMLTGIGSAVAWLGAGRSLAGVPLAGVAAAAAAQADSSSPSLERRLAEYAASVRYEDLPNAVVLACKRLLLDALACALGAVGTAPAKISEATFRKAFGAGGTATVIGDPHLISTEGAVLVNGTLLRQLDLNDVYFGKDPSHPSEIIPAAIACCEEVRGSGRGLIEAMVVGYETEIRLNKAISWASWGFIASSAAAFAVPLVAGKVWRMGIEQMTHAMGISGPRQLTALAVNGGEISMMKSVGPAYTAMDGVFSTRLAAAGLTGVGSSIEWLTSNLQPQQTQAVAQVDLDPGRYLLTLVGLKRFPLQGELQAVAEAGVNLHSRIAQVGLIREIVVQAYPGTIKRGVAEPAKFRPANRETADHSLPICLALALLDGDVTDRQYAAGRWKAPEVLSLAQKVKVQASQTLVTQMPEGHGTIVEVRLNDGQVLRESVLIPEGDAQRPMSERAMEHKFRQFADPVLGEGGSTKVIDAVNRLEELEDVGLLTMALRHGRAA